MSPVLLSTRRDTKLYSTYGYAQSPVQSNHVMYKKADSNASTKVATPDEKSDIDVNMQVL